MAPAFHDRHGTTATGKVQRGGQSRKARADDHDASAAATHRAHQDVRSIVVGAVCRWWPVLKRISFLVARRFAAGYPLGRQRIGEP
ncbi:hypothetical protein MARA_19430 [Mycolicibacterium arabiense]|uniref:Uncharacterized protein n=1 Tax=Mycolicibacterium arabiense TaxID=1286181 RepID=A0A7I7RXM0_9MYCO|nr:hypothetical protein MARA_19430 [Mycolicibacterium arabiense]